MHYKIDTRSAENGKFLLVSCGPGGPRRLTGSIRLFRVARVHYSKKNKTLQKFRALDACVRIKNFNDLEMVRVCDLALVRVLKLVLVSLVPLQHAKGHLNRICHL